jgi:hypothetical protein
LQVEALNEQHQQHGGDHVPEVDLLLLLHDGPLRSSLFSVEPRAFIERIAELDRIPAFIGAAAAAGCNDPSD